VSSYEIDYSRLEGDAKRDQAMADCRSYLGDRFDTVNVIVENAIADGEDDDSILFALSFAGVRGYPAQAWIDMLRKAAK
jgi:hypothetical protein